MAGQQAQAQTNSKPKLSDEEALKIQLGPNHCSEDQQNRIKGITDAAFVFGKAILANMKNGADRATSIRKLRECKFTAVSGISCEEFI